MSARRLSASRSAGCCRPLEPLGCPKGVFGGCVPDRPALKCCLNFLYSTAFAQLPWEPQESLDQAALARQLPTQELIPLLAAKGLRQATGEPAR